MSTQELKSLLEKGESLNLDWKKDFPPDLLRGRRSPDWDKGRGKLLRALISLANSSGSSPAFLIYGVKDMGNLLHNCDTEEEGKKPLTVSSLFSVN